MPGDGAFMKAPGHGLALDRVAQVREVALERLAVLVGDRASADRAQVLRGRARGGEAVAEARVGVEVGGRRARDVADLEAAQAMADEGRIADLAHLAVADDVDARVDLVLHAVLDRAPMTRSYSCGSTSSPLSSAKTMSTTSCGRGRLPTCVVRMRPFSAMSATL
jgi:hypothetical protein